MHWCLRLCGIVTVSIVYLYACVRRCKRKRRLLKESCQILPDWKTGTVCCFLSIFIWKSGCSHLKRVCHIWWPQKQLSQNTWLMLSCIQVIPSRGWKYQISSMLVRPTLTDVHRYTKCDKDASKVILHTGIFSGMLKTSCEPCHGFKLKVLFMLPVP